MTWHTLSRRQKILNLRRIRLRGANMPKAARSLGTSHDSVRSFLYKVGLSWGTLENADGSEGKRNKARPRNPARDELRRSMKSLTANGFTFSECAEQLGLSRKSAYNLISAEYANVIAFQADALEISFHSTDTDSRRQLIIASRIAELRLRSEHGTGARYERTPQQVLVRRNSIPGTIEPAPLGSGCSCALTFA